MSTIKIVVVVVNHHVDQAFLVSTVYVALEME